MAQEGPSHLLRPGCTRKLIQPLAVVFISFYDQYALSPATLIPAGKPIWYFRLVDGADMTAHGEQKAWWRIFFGLEQEGLEDKVRRGELDEKIGLPRRPAEGPYPGCSI